MLNYAATRATRVSARAKLFQPVEVHSAAGRRRAHLLDLSATGALLALADLPGSARILTLHCGGVQRIARVAWAVDGRCGIAFARPLAPAELEELLAIGTGARR